MPAGRGVGTAENHNHPTAAPKTPTTLCPAPNAEDDTERSSESKRCYKKKRGNCNRAGTPSQNYPRNDVPSKTTSAPSSRSRVLVLLAPLPNSRNGPQEDSEAPQAEDA